MKVKTSTANPPANRRADRTRQAILRASIREFSANGLAGARTDAIAASAKVNKALLYYYFKNKSGLYAAALEEVSAAAVERALEAFDSQRSPGECLLRTALNHFDRILTKLEFQSLLQQEMVRVRRGQSEAMPLLIERIFKPLTAKLQEAVQQGVKSGELVQMDWLQMVYAGLGANVFYFLSAPLMRYLLPVDPLDNAAIESRRRAAVQFLGNALFVDRAHGASVAKRVLADMPMPKVRNARVRRSLYERT
jgi:TetR/AcrR family transcriptional regulator